MSDTSTLIVDSARRIFADLCTVEVIQAAEGGLWPERLHNTLEENGLLQLGVAESGTTLEDLFAFLSEAGYHAAPLPLADRLLAAHLLGTGAGNAQVVQQLGDTLVALWPEQADELLAVAPGGTVLRVNAASLAAEPGVTLAGEPLAHYTLEPGAGTHLETEADAYALSALGRAALMSGALRRVLEFALRYAGEREQFGRSLSKFQAIQHQLAVAAAEVAAAMRATDAAVHGAAGGAPRFTDVAVAKARVGQAAGVVAEIAHQVHGAMGFTQEHPLQLLTRRLWQWRDDFGTETDWAGQLGDLLCELPPEGLWAFVAEHD